MRVFVAILGLSLAGIVLLQPKPDNDCVGPNCPAPPPAPPIKPPEPKRPAPRKPWGLSIQATVGGRLAPNGEPIQIDLPGEQHLRNKGGSDGAGLCVFTSIDHAARWHGEDSLVGFRDWMTKHPGGSWPEKTDKMIQKICQERGKTAPPYLNVSGADIDLIEKALAAGHLVANTYAISPTGRYGGARIAHMVNTVHAKNGQFGVLDNNHPGADRIEWMSREEYQRTEPNWVVILLRHGPPPPPRLED